MEFLNILLFAQVCLAVIFVLSFIQSWRTYSLCASIFVWSIVGTLMVSAYVTDEYRGLLEGIIHANALR